MALTDAFQFTIKQKTSMRWQPKIMNVSGHAAVDDRRETRSVISLAAKNELVFEHGEISKVIAIPIINDLEAEKDESFAVELYDPRGGAQLGKHTKTVVTIINDDGKALIDRIISNTSPLR